MLKKSLSLQYREGNNLEELSEKIQDLITETMRFSGNAYAPYSKFHVSAGLMLSDGTIVKGANMENASYPVSICAERTLLSHTITNYPKQTIDVMVIYVDRNLEHPVPPCGICRQTLLEVELNQKQAIEVILITKGGKFIIFDRAADLLPLYFDGSVL